MHPSQKLIPRSPDRGQGQDRIHGDHGTSRTGRCHLAHNCNTRSLRTAMEIIATATTPVPHRDFSATPHNTAAGGTRIMVTKYVRTSPVGTGSVSPIRAIMPTISAIT